MTGHHPTLTTAGRVTAVACDCGWRTTARTPREGSAAWAGHLTDMAARVRSRPP